ELRVAAGEGLVARARARGIDVGGRALLTFVPPTGGDMDPEATRAAQAELQPGERLQWAGRPGAGALAPSQLGGTILRPPFLALPLVWTAVASSRAPLSADAAFQVGSLFWLFGLIFVCAGICMVLRAPLAYLRAPSMVYGVTDRRVFIVNRRRTRSWRPRDI